MNEIVNAYIQQAGLDKTQAQQLMQELQALDETQLQQVLGKMQQQLQGQQAPQHQMEDGSMMEGTAHPERMQNGGKASKDSLDLYNYYQLQSKLEGKNNSYFPSKFEKFVNGIDGRRLPSVFKTQREEVLSNFPTFRKTRVENAKKTFKERKEIQQVFKTEGNYLKQQQKLWDAADKLVSSNPDITYANPLNSPDIRHREIQPIGNYFGTGGNYIYQKPFSIKEQKISTPAPISTVQHSQIFSKPITETKLKRKPTSSLTKNTQPIVYPELQEEFPSIDEHFVYENVFLPSEDQYIPLKDKEYTTGQESYELNSDYVRRMHELQKGNKQAPKLIRNQYGGIPVDENGLYSFPNQNVVVPTQGTGKIQMRGIPHPVAAYDADTMEYLDMMYPDQEYEFDADNILEIPKGKFGISKMQAGGKKPRIVNVRGKGGKMYEAELDPSTGLYEDQFGNMWEYNPQKKDAKVVYDIEQDEEQVGTKSYYENQKDLKQKATKTTPKTSPSKSKDEFGFISQLKGNTSRAENIGDYVSWKNEWNDMIPNFSSKPYKEQQQLAMDWVKTNKPDVYEGLKNQWEAQGYKKGDSFEGYLKDGMYANITSSLRPSLLNDRVAPIAPIERKPTGLNTKIPTTLPLADIQKKVSVPTIEDDSINPADAIIGKLDNRDMSGRYLSNMKLRNNEIKLPYFQQVDLKTPQLYQQDITPYINNLYTGYNSAAQNIDMNSAVGQAQALQLNANLDKSINDVSGTVYNQNLKAAIDWENQLTGIYNQQSQLDNQNRAAYSDGVDLVRTNKQNVDNQIDALAYEHKMKQIQNQNNMMLSTLLHPDFYTTDEGNGQMVLKRKYNPAPKANTTNTNDELEYWKKLALEKNPKAAKYGIGKKKAMC